MKLRTQRRNANRHTERGLAALKTSIGSDGWIGAITVAADGETFDGSARLEVGGVDAPIIVESDGSRPVVVKRTDIATADDPRAVRLGIAANRIAQIDLEWEPAVLAEVAGMVDLSGLFDADELRDLMQAVQVEPGGGGDEFDTTPDDGPTRTKLGELWSIGGVHRLLVGDCTDAANVARLMGGERADQMITDPPYGVDYAEKNAFLNANDQGSRIEIDIENDDIADYLIFFTDFLKVAQMADYNTVYIFMSPKEYPTLRLAATNAGYKWSVDLVWNKNNHVLTRQDYFGKHEMIFYGWYGKHHFYGDKGMSVLDYPRPMTSDQHPTTKPLELVERLMTDGSDVGAVTYDPFLGSGTTLIAAHRTGRRCYGMEIAPRYADVILRRAEAEGLECTLIDSR